MSTSHAVALELPWILVAAPALVDPPFKKSVVLIVAHSDEGSMGFVLNRPIETPLAELVTPPPDLTIPDAVPVWFGGPVETTTGVILHTAPERPGHVAVAASEDALRELIATAVTRLGRDEAGPAVENEKLYPYRFAIGYAGWSSGQLDEELRRGSWLQCPLDQDLLFNTAWKDMWARALQGVGTNARNLVTPVQEYLN